MEKAAAEKAAAAQAAAEAEAAARAASADDQQNQDGSSKRRLVDGTEDGENDVNDSSSHLYNGEGIQGDNSFDGSFNQKDIQGGSLLDSLGSGGSSGFNHRGNLDSASIRGGNAGAQDHLAGRSAQDVNSDQWNGEHLDANGNLADGAKDRDGGSSREGDAHGLGKGRGSASGGLDDEDLDSERRRRQEGHSANGLEDNESGSGFACSCSSDASKCPKCGNCRKCGTFRGTLVGCDECAKAIERRLLGDASDWRVTPIFDTLRLLKAHELTAEKLTDLFSTLGIDRENITAVHVAAVLVCILIGKGNETAEQLSVVFNALGINKDNIVMKDLLPLFQALSINRDNVMKSEMKQLFMALSVDKESLTVEQMQAVFAALDIDQDSVTADHVTTVFGALEISKENVTLQQMSTLFTALHVNKRNLHPLHILAICRALKVDHSNVTAGLITSLFASLQITSAGINEDHLLGLCQALGINKTNMTIEQVAIIKETLCNKHEAVALEQMSALLHALGVELEHSNENELAVLIRAMGLDKSNMIEKFDEAVVILEALGIGNDATKADQHLTSLFCVLEVDSDSETKQKMSALFKDILMQRNSKILSQLAAVFKALGTDLGSIGIDIDSITPQQLAVMLSILGNSIDQITTQQSDRMASIFGSLGKINYNAKEGNNQQYACDEDKENHPGQQLDALENCNVSAIEPHSESKAVVRVADQKRRLIQQAGSSLHERREDLILTDSLEKEDLSWLDGFSMRTADQPSVSEAETALDQYRSGLFDCIAAGAWQPPWLGSVVPGRQKLQHSLSEGGLESGDPKSLVRSLSQMIHPEGASKVEARKSNRSFSRRSRVPGTSFYGALPGRSSSVKFQRSVSGEHFVRWQDEVRETSGISMTKSAVSFMPAYDQGAAASQVAAASVTPEFSDAIGRQRRISNFMHSQPVPEKFDPWFSFKSLENSDPTPASVNRQRKGQSMRRTSSGNVAHFSDSGPRNSWCGTLRDSFNPQHCYDTFRPQIPTKPKLPYRKWVGNDARGIKFNALQQQLSS
eukprot:gnl/MRDRNA2_/MRDRNA2_28166_c0_seq1.p1 gnl/MRDRNA2_/MRDRNA2_28166_c0~~gnl/MRDRNA2_/MRDRNA2_28166_c0_seq1.p1  ORF type:complete len:1200 (-),score=244.38 gnl/MRDRNA2_/MRDRNA2_28166_c0_seq1:33-3140(-)